MMDSKAFLAAIQGARGAIETRKASGISTVTVPKGESRWRILPGWRPTEPGVFYHDFGRHWIKDSSGKVLATYVCERDTFGRPCEIDDAISAAIRSTKDDKTLEALKEMTSRRRVLVNALFLSSGEKEAATTPVLLELPTTLFESYIKLAEQRAKDEIYILSADEGRDVIITREGVGLTTKYGMTDAPKNTAVAKEALARLINIDAYIEAERNKGVAKGVSILNEQIADRLKLPAPGRASLLGAAAAATAATAAAVAGMGSFTGVTATPALEAARRVAEPEPVTAAVDDEELRKLIESIDA